MRQNRQSKVVAILALCVSVVGLTLGFAAFSNTLTISSSVTVSPDSSDFKITIYGQTENSDRDVFDSTTLGYPYHVSINVDALPAKINNDNLTINIDEVTINTGHGVARYEFLIVNEGKYNVYITEQDFPNNDIIKRDTVCTAIDDVSPELLNETCSNNILYFTLTDQDDNIVASYPRSDSVDYIELAPGEYAYLDVMLGLSPLDDGNYVLADGKYSIKFPDVQLKFSTVNPES